MRLTDQLTDKEIWAAKPREKKDYHEDTIERQLAHKPQNNVRGSYNHAKYLIQRRTMMQNWADYLSQLREVARGRRA